QGEVLTSPDSDLNKILVSNELKAALEKELSKFGTKQQLALKFFIYEQERIKDISQIMDLPIGTVSSLIRRGQEILRKKLKKLIES
ncbi:MAG: hypothetical protein HQ594_07140, partial [Candidatus Omnitrophica bacterium]|nr:hypothetical protein [Candidatus Omnitrophota bacterium]